MYGAVDFYKACKVITLAVKSVNLIKTRPLRNIHFAADDSVYPLILTGFIKVDGAVHNTVIRHRDGFHSEFFDALYQRLYTASPVKQ